MGSFLSLENYRRFFLSILGVYFLVFVISLYVTISGVFNIRPGSSIVISSFIFSLIIQFVGLYLAIKAFKDFKDGKREAHYYFLAWVVLAIPTVVQRLFYFAGQLKIINYYRCSSCWGDEMFIVFLIVSGLLFIASHKLYFRDSDKGEGGIIVFLDKLRRMDFIMSVFYILTIVSFISISLQVVLAFALVNLAGLGIFSSGGSGFSWVLLVLAYGALVIYLLRKHRLFGIFLVGMQTAILGRGAFSVFEVFFRGYVFTQTPVRLFLEAIIILLYLFYIVSILVVYRKFVLEKLSKKALS